MTVKGSLKKSGLENEYVSQSGRRLALLLVCWQIIVTVVGSVCVLHPPGSSAALRALVVVEVALAIGMVALGFERGFLRPKSALLAIFGLSIVIMSLGARVLVGQASLGVYIDNALRLGLPLCIALAMTKAPEIIGHSIHWIRHYSFVTDVCACATVLVLGAARYQGWSGAWITDPLIPVVAFPALFRQTGLSAPRLFLYGLVVILSGKRWDIALWMAALVVGVLLQNRRKIKYIVLTGMTLVVAGYLLSTLGYLSTLEDRGMNTFKFYRSGELLNSTSVTAADPSIGQRMEEIDKELASLHDNPINFFFGRNLADIRLENGKVTHAIHCTPVFLLVRGGLFWLLALFWVRGRRSGKMPRSFGLAIAVTLLDSFAANMTLDPGFLVSLAALVQRRST